jgi:Tol biopolymer transport system component
LVVSAGRPGSTDLWSINTDGGDQRQLTNSPLDDLYALTSADGNSIFFASNRTGETQVWRMKADGSDQKQITAVEGGIPLGISTDGAWLYYHSALGKTLRRILVTEGREELIVDKLRSDYSVSPDCSLAAFADGMGSETKLTVVTLPDGQTAGTYRLGGGQTRISAMVWSTDGKNLFYVTNDGVSESSTVWVQSLNTTLPSKIFEMAGEDLRNESSFAVSPDGKSFAVIQGSWKRDAVLLRGLG